VAFKAFNASDYRYYCYCWTGVFRLDKFQIRKPVHKNFSQHFQIEGMP